MGTQDNSKPRSRGTVRMAVIAAALAVAGCFTAAFTFTGDAVTAAEEAR